MESSVQDYQWVTNMAAVVVTVTPEAMVAAGAAVTAAEAVADHRITPAVVVVVAANNLGIFLIIGVLLVGGYFLMTSMKPKPTAAAGGLGVSPGYEPAPEGYGDQYPIPHSYRRPPRHAMGFGLGLPRPHPVPPFHPCHANCNIAKNEMACVSCLYPHDSECYAECMIAKNEIACRQCMMAKY